MSRHKTFAPPAEVAAAIERSATTSTTPEPIDDEHARPVSPTRYVGPPTSTTRTVIGTSAGIDYRDGFRLLAQLGIGLRAVDGRVEIVDRIHDVIRGELHRLLRVGLWSHDSDVANVLKIGHDADAQTISQLQALLADDLPEPPPPVPLPAPGEIERLLAGAVEAAIGVTPDGTRVIDRFDAKGPDLGTRRHVPVTRELGRWCGHGRVNTATLPAWQRTMLEIVAADDADFGAWIARIRDADWAVARGDASDHELTRAAFREEHRDHAIATWRRLQREGGDGMTHDEIAGELGVSTTRVRQIEQRALAKVKRTLQKSGVSFDDLLPERPQGTPEP